MYSLAKANKKASSRMQIDIKGVEDNILILPGSEYRLVLLVSSVNFELKSEDEQDALIETYQSFLNSLAGDLQIIVRVRELDIDEYVMALESRLANETESVYVSQINNYTSFVKSLIKSNRILSRQFYVVVSYKGDKKQDFDIAKEQIGIRADIIAKGLMRLGIQSKSLSGLELVDLFYSFYSPRQAKNQPLNKSGLFNRESFFLSRESL
jgi:hypothetical protein